MGQVLTIVNIVLTLLSKIVEWGQRAKVFDEAESVIALTILRNTQRDIEIANKSEKDTLDSVRNNPTGELQPNEFERD